MPRGCCANAATATRDKHAASAETENDLKDSLMVFLVDENGLYWSGRMIHPPSRNELPDLWASLHMVQGADELVH